MGCSHAISYSWYPKSRLSLAYTRQSGLVACWLSNPAVWSAVALNGCPSCISYRRGGVTSSSTLEVQLFKQLMLTGSRDHTYAGKAGLAYLPMVSVKGYTVTS
jgi:hypothetical protein